MGLVDKFFSLFKRKKDKEPPSEDKEETKSEESKEETPSVITEEKAPEDRSSSAPHAAASSRARYSRTATGYLRTGKGTDQEAASGFAQDQAVP